MLSAGIVALAALLQRRNQWQPKHETRAMDKLQFLRLVQFVRNTDMLTEVGEAGVEAMLPEATAKGQLDRRRKRIDAWEERDVKKREEPHGVVRIDMVAMPLEEREIAECCETFLRSRRYKNVLAESSLVPGTCTVARAYFGDRQSSQVTLLHRWSPLGAGGSFVPIGLRASICRSGVSGVPLLLLGVHPRLVPSRQQFPGQHSGLFGNSGSQSFAQSAGFITTKIFVASRELNSRISVEPRSAKHCGVSALHSQNAGGRRSPPFLRNCSHFTMSGRSPARLGSGRSSISPRWVLL